MAVKEMSTEGKRIMSKGWLREWESVKRREGKNGKDDQKATLASTSEEKVKS